MPHNIVKDRSFYSGRARFNNDYLLNEDGDCEYITYALIETHTLNVESRAEKYLLSKEEIKEVFQSYNLIASKNILSKNESKELQVLTAIVKKQYELYKAYELIYLFRNHNVKYPFTSFTGKRYLSEVFPSKLSKLILDFFTNTTEDPQKLQCFNIRTQDIDCRYQTKEQFFLKTATAEKNNDQWQEFHAKLQELFESNWKAIRIGFSRKNQVGHWAVLVRNEDQKSVDFIDESKKITNITIDQMLLCQKLLNPEIKVWREQQIYFYYSEQN